LGNRKKNRGINWGYIRNNLNHFMVTKYLSFNHGFLNANHDDSLSHYKIWITNGDEKFLTQKMVFYDELLSILL